MSAIASKAQSHIVVRPSTPIIGAEIEGVDLSKQLSLDEVNDIHQALLQWKVLFFRDQPISDEEHLAFGRYFGKLTPAHPIMLGLPHQPAIWERAAADYTPKYRPDLNVPTSRPNRDYKGWHIDITFVANPNKYSILRGVEIPPYGGDTLWSNLEAAYDGLSPQIRNLIDGLQVVHRTN
ncbi:MAG TPA: TauD/TfdA family dioxygenase, partial [Rhizomicrobium sp.]|nr:TauD/TfdA family dioxygenase [Rhizomicrobium sp.]